MTHTLDEKEEQSMDELDLWMKSLGFEPWVVQGGEVTLWRPANNANLPDVTVEQAAFFCSIIHQKELEARIDESQSNLWVCGKQVKESDVVMLEGRIKRLVAQLNKEREGK